MLVSVGKVFVVMVVVVVMVMVSWLRSYCDVQDEACLL